MKSQHSVLWVTAAAMTLRAAFFFLKSADYIDFLRPWFDALAAAEGFGGIGLAIGNYMVSYLYVLAGLTYLPLDSLVSIKLVSCLGDILLAYFSGKLAQKVTKSDKSFFAVYTAVLFLPTVILNSSAWAQCDALYTAALVACVYCVLCNCPAMALFVYGIAFALKLQAVFLAPFLLFLLLKRKIKLRHCAWVPAVYAAVALPAAVAGRSWWDLLTIYLRQAKTYDRLSLCAPNLYAFFTPENTTLFSRAGIAVFVLFTGVLLWILWNKKTALTPRYLLLLALLFVLLTPYMLPHMHERYFYPADVLCVVYAAVNPKRWWISAVIVTCSFLVVCKFLFGWLFVSEALLALPMLCALVALLREAVAFDEAEPLHTPHIAHP